MIVGQGRLLINLLGMHSPARFAMTHILSLWVSADVSLIGKQSATGCAALSNETVVHMSDPEQEFPEKPRALQCTSPRSRRYRFGLAWICYSRRAVSTKIRLPPPP